MEEIFFEGENGAIVDALWGSPTEPIAAIVMLHPASADKSSMQPEAAHLINAGFACLIPNAPWARPAPYTFERGSANQEPMFRQTVADAVVATRQAQRRSGVGPGRVALIGRNVGGALCGAIAVQNSDVAAAVGLACLTKMSQFWQTSDHPVAKKQRAQFDTQTFNDSWARLADLDLLACAPNTHCQFLLQFGRLDNWTTSQEAKAFSERMGDQAGIEWYEDGHEFLSRDAMIARLNWLRAIFLP